MSNRVKTIVVGIMGGILIGAFPVYAYACGGGGSGSHVPGVGMTNVCVKVPVDETWSQHDLDILTSVGYVDGGEYQISPACFEREVYPTFIPTVQEWFAQ